MKALGLMTFPRTGALKAGVLPEVQFCTGHCQSLTWPLLCRYWASSAAPWLCTVSVRLVPICKTKQGEKTWPLCVCVCVSFCLTAGNLVASSDVFVFTLLQFAFYLALLSVYLLNLWFSYDNN